MRPQSQNGMTLTELLIAGLLLGGIFLAVTTVHVSSLKLLTGQMNTGGVDPLLALEHISRNVRIANEVIVDGADVTGGKTQLKLRIDPANPGTPGPADDHWIVYRFINRALRWKTVTPPAPVSAVDAGSPEVVPGLTLSTANPSSFNLTSPNVVEIDVAPAGRSESVITTSVMLTQRSA